MYTGIYDNHTCNSVESINISLLIHTHFFRPTRHIVHLGIFLGGGGGGAKFNLSKVPLIEKIKPQEISHYSVHLIGICCKDIISCKCYTLIEFLMIHDVRFLSNYNSRSLEKGNRN